MTELKITTKSTHYVDAYDLCRFLTEKIGRKIVFGQSSNDTDYSCLADGNSDSWEDQEEEVNEIIKSGYINCDYPGWDSILSYAANQNWIPEGNYVVRVSW